MSFKDTLPAAVDFEDRRSLCDLDDSHLSKLMDDCEAWFAWMDGFHAGLSTSAGRTEWDVLMRHEQDDVAAAHGRIRDEIVARRTT